LPMVSSTLPKSRPLPVVLRIASRESIKLLMIGAGLRIHHGPGRHDAQAPDRIGIES
jgi:hypothetical protein